MASRTPNQGGLGPCHLDDERPRGHNTNTRTGLAPAPTEATAVNTLVAALRRELHTQQARYQAQIAGLTGVPLCLSSRWAGGRRVAIGGSGKRLVRRAGGRG
jgi:hypothetical protein